MSFKKSLSALLIFADNLKVPVINNQVSNSQIVKLDFEGLACPIVLDGVSLDIGLTVSLKDVLHGFYPLSLFLDLIIHYSFPVVKGFDAILRIFTFLGKCIDTATQ